MATYYMTPHERRARVQELKERRQNRYLYHKYLRNKKEIEKAKKSTQINAKKTAVQTANEKKKDSANWAIRSFSTIGDVVGNVLIGATKSLEGIFDLGAGVVGAVGGIFSDDFQDDVKDYIAYDFTGEWVAEPLQEAFRYSLLENDGIAENVLRGVGQMLPAVAVSVATAGAGAPAAFSQAASLTTMGVSAAGTSTEEAFQDGANYYAGLGYGVASGLVEVGTEKAFGGATKALTGAGIFDGITKSVAETGWKRVAKNALEEGFEEATAEIVNPALKSIYKGKEAFSEYGQGEFWKGVGQSAITGSLTALAYSGSVGYGMAKKGYGFVGKDADINDSLTEISSLKEKATNMQAEDNLDDISEAKIATATRENYRNIEKTLQKLSEDKRANAIKKFDLDRAFNTDGTMSEQLTSWLNASTAFATNAKADSDTPVNFKKSSYSFSRRGDEQTIRADLDMLSENRAQAYLEERQALGENITIEQAREAVGRFSVFAGEMSEREAEARKTFNKALNALNKITGNDISFVIVDENDTFSANIVGGNTLYIGKDTFENNSWAENLIHEYIHQAEGFVDGTQEVQTEAYKVLYDFLKSDNILVDVKIDGEVKRIPLWQKAQNAVLSKNYGMTVEQIDSIFEKTQNGEPLTEQEAKVYHDFKTEVVAHETGFLLGNEQFIDRLVTADSSLAERIVKRIINLKQAFLKTGEAKAEIQTLRRAEGLYLSAARQAGNIKLFKFILDHDRDLKEEVNDDVDSDAQIVYNKKYKRERAYYSQYNTTAMQWAFSSKTKSGDIKVLYNPQDNTWNKLVADDTEERYGTLLSIKDTTENAEAIRSLRKEVENENHREKQEFGESVYEDFAEYWDIRRSDGDDNFDVEEQDANGRSREVHGRESEGDRSGDSRQSTRNNGGVKSTLKDTDEQTEAGYILKDETKLDLSAQKEDTDEDSLHEQGRDFLGDYTEEEYDSFGWARANEVLSARENERLRSLFADAVSKRANPPKTKLGEYMIAIGEDADNKIAYMTGEIDKPVITRILEIDEYNETTLSETRSHIYAIEREGIRQKTGGIFTLHTRFDFKDYATFKGSVVQDVGHNNQLGANRGAGSGTLEGAQRRVRSPYLKVVHTFTDITGRKRNILKINNEYMIEGDSRSKYQPSIEAAIHAENERIIRRYAEKFDTTQSWVKNKLLTDPDFLIKQRKKGVRFNLVDNSTAKPYSYELTNGQVKKLLADFTKKKVYNKSEAEGIINAVVGNYLFFGDTYGAIAGKSKAEVVNMLWEGLNTAKPGRQAEVALNVAEYIIQNSIVENIYDDVSNEIHADTIAVLKPYLHSLNLDGIKAEIKHRYDKDNSPYLLWGKRKGTKGVSADAIASELEGLGFHIEAINEADIFFQIHEAYRAAVEGIKKDAKSILNDTLDKNERKQLKQDIAREILQAFETHGTPSKLSEIIDKYTKTAQAWKERFYEEREKNKVLNRVLDKTQKIKDFKLGTFLNASQYKTDIFKGSIERLSSIKNRGNLNRSGTRKILSSLLNWYNEDNPMLNGIFEEDIHGALISISQNEKPLSEEEFQIIKELEKRFGTNDYSKLRDNYTRENLGKEYDGKIKRLLYDLSSETVFTVQELQHLENIIDYFKHFAETYNKVYRNGKYVDAEPIARRYVDIIHDNQKTKVGWMKKVFEWYLQGFADPMTLARYMDKYSDGFYTEMLGALRKGAVGASVMEMEIREPLEAFYKKHKSFLRDIQEKTVKFQGADIPVRQAMQLYMSLNREQAVLGLAKSGFAYFNKDKNAIRIAGFAVEEGMELEDIRIRLKEVQNALAEQFSDAEKEYMSIAEKLFNVDCKEAKKTTDIQRRGYSNVLDDYYIPIRRYVRGMNIDEASTFADEMNRVSRASFNKETVQGAKNELLLEGIDTILERHIRAVAQYANLALAIDEFNILYNLDTSANPNKPISVKTEGFNNWHDNTKYFEKLISDIQGIPSAKRSISTSILGKLRGGHAKYQLGANPKVWVTQLSSFAAATSILDVDCIIRGIGIRTSDVDKYCALAKLRNNDNTAALAQGVIEKTGKLGDALMKPIGVVDRFVVTRLFGACQIQVEKTEGLKRGTEENKIKAGELLERVILETQQNAMATERSSAMRSGSEIEKTLTMFSADSMKVIGRVIDSIGEVSVLKAKRKAATNAEEIAQLDKQIKAATKNACRATASLVSSAVLMALIAQAFRTLYKKDDEDEDIVQNMTVDAFGNLLGGLPFIRDLHSRFIEGYDFDNYAYSAINDLFDSAEKIFSAVGNIFEDGWDSREIATAIKSVLFATGQVSGIPTRNIYNFTYGLTKRFSPSTAYKIDDAFYKQSYRSDLAKAIENEDEAMMATIAGLMLDESVGGMEDRDARKAMDALIQKGFDVIPRSVRETITYDGTEYTLTAKQRKAFEKTYFIANEAIANLADMSQFKVADDEVKAKAINFIYNVYYNLALQDFLGVDLENKNILFAEAMDIEKLALIVCTARSIVGDTDKTGKTVNGSRKRKIQAYINSLRLTANQKYMVMGYLGYSNQYGKEQVSSYINRLSLTKAEKQALLKYSGYSA